MAYADHVYNNPIIPYESVFEDKIHTVHTLPWAGVNGGDKAGIINFAVCLASFLPLCELLLTCIR